MSVSIIAGDLDRARGRKSRVPRRVAEPDRAGQRPMFMMGGAAAWRSAVRRSHRKPGHHDRSRGSHFAALYGQL